MNRNDRYGTQTAEPAAARENSLINEPLTADDVLAQVTLIREIKSRIMKSGVHYDTIPGTDKPTLLKPGAEVLLQTFKLAAEPEIHDLSTRGDARIRTLCRGVSIPTGRFIGAGVGECSTAEERYAWRNATCDEEWEQTPEHERRFRWRHDGACTRQVRVHPADRANTVLKMSKKRALVDLALTATAASELFTQDLDETEPLSLEPPADPPRHREDHRQGATQAAGEPMANPFATRFAGLRIDEGENRRGPWLKYTLQTAHGVSFTSFADKLPEGMEVWMKMLEPGEPIEIRWAKDRYGYKILDLFTPEPPETPESPEPPESPETQETQETPEAREAPARSRTEGLKRRLTGGNGNGHGVVAQRNGG